MLYAFIPGSGGGGGWGTGVLKYEIGIYVPRRVSNGRLRERPLTENEGFQSGPSREKQGILELNITKKRIFFFKTRVFSTGERCIFIRKVIMNL